MEQLRTIDKKRLRDKVCHLDGIIIKKIYYALKSALSWSIDLAKEEIKMLQCIFRNKRVVKERVIFMSGHSKFANIKHKKEKNDAARGRVFYHYRPVTDCRCSQRGWSGTETTTAVFAMLLQSKSK